MGKKDTNTTSAAAYAFTQLADRLESLVADDLMRANANLDDAAMAGLVLADRANEASRKPLFDAIPELLMEKGMVARLEKTALAAQHIALEARSEETETPNAKVDPLLIQEAADLRANMLQVIEYNLSHVESVVREVADIKLGFGYLDTARDLRRNAKLYGTHAAVLKKDTVKYDAKDLARANELAGKIEAQVRESQSRTKKFGALRGRVFNELTFVYGEVKAAADFIYRSDETSRDQFPAMRVLMGIAATTRAKKDGSVEAPAGETERDEAGKGNG